MSKGLEAIQKYRDGFEMLPSKIDIIEKELKALEIIKKKRVDVGFLDRDLSSYNVGLPRKHILTQEEYDLLKEVLL